MQFGSIEKFQVVISYEFGYGLWDMNYECLSIAYNP